MAAMPRGEPRTVPDPAGDLYDRKMAQDRAERLAAERRGAAGQARSGGLPTISRPSTLQSFIPVVGPAWEAAADLQDRNYAGAAFNGAMAVADVLPFGVAAKGLRAASKGIGLLKRGSVTAGASSKAMRKVGFAGPGQEIHHTVPLNGLGRNVQDPRNHFALLKVLPKEQHRRLTGSWNGKPMYDPVRKLWYGTTDWMKAVPTGVAGYGADTVENLRRPGDPDRSGR